MGMTDDEKRAASKFLEIAKKTAILKVQLCGVVQRH